MGTSFLASGMREIALVGQTDMRVRHYLVGIFLAVAVGRGYGQSPPPPGLDGEILKGIDRLFLQDYDGAMSLFRGVSRAYGDHPAGYLLQAGVLQTEAMDYEALVERSVFDSLLSLAEEKARHVIERHPDDALGYFYLGSVYGSHSFADAAEGDWYGAATSAMASVSQFEDALERDSTLDDAKLGIGTYYYWKSRQMAFLTWIPFIGDDREEGIRLIEETIRRGRYNRYAAMTSLISIFLDAEQYAKAITVSEKALAEYPENRLFLWGLATAHERLGHGGQAIAAYRQLLRSIAGDARANPYNELVCRVNLARLEWHAGRREEARNLLAPVLGRSPDAYADHLHERAAKKLREAKELSSALAKD
jgi:tetratricopeptide (TPR) repeat protein